MTTDLPPPEPPARTSAPTASYVPATRPAGAVAGASAGASNHPFQQPSNKRKGKDEPKPMTGLAAEIAARLKETFYSYDNRRTSDNRSAQTHLGPSEIGTPCDRRLAMSLMQIPAVNPGDGWAAFVGTCIHAGLADMFVWANAGSGRYAVEMPLEFPSALVPKGTGDLLDRVLLVFVDHKGMGRWSRKKLKTKGPSETYRVQVHVYGYGARLRGEKVEYVAIVGWPRDEATLDDLYVWVEKYDPQVARDALARVDAIAERISSTKTGNNYQIAAGFSTADDCRWCPHHMPGATDLSNGGCNGRT